MMHNLSDSFHTHLEARIADSEDLRIDAHKVRFKVYCLERGYEDHRKFPDRMERDKFDNESVHAVVRHKSSKHPVGVVRLVLPNKKNPYRKFPIESHFGHLFEPQIMNRFHFTRHNIAEVSRFAVSKQSLRDVHSRLVTESLRSLPTRMSDDDPKQLLPHISLGLIALLFAISEKQGVEYWYAAMEPSLSRLLTRLGIRFTPIGPIMDYHGRRQPMIAQVSELLRNIQRSRKDFFRLIEDVGGVPAFATQMKRNPSPGNQLMESRFY
ncbi:MAG: PEP-CTERM/exosortase system-associated acyltransferase [Gammaproteobacteria bacterium]|nr:PEP-CTERM/exosortase system-associated acyltransferase [Gammaproteobacteria bacterium]